METENAWGRWSRGVCRVETQLGKGTWLGWAPEPSSSPLSLWFGIHSATTGGTRWYRDDPQLSILKTGLLVTGNSMDLPSSLQSQKADLARPVSSYGESAADVMLVA